MIFIKNLLRYMVLTPILSVIFLHALADGKNESDLKKCLDVSGVTTRGMVDCYNNSIKFQEKSIKIKINTLKKLMPAENISKLESVNSRKPLLINDLCGLYFSSESGTVSSISFASCKLSALNNYSNELNGLIDFYSPH